MDFTTKMKTEDFSIDKLTCMTDLHLHLDGAISVESAKKLAVIQNLDIPNNDADIKNLLSVSPGCKNLNDFLEKFKFPYYLLQSTIGIRKAVEDLLDELEKQGVMYCEIRFAPQLLTSKGLTQDEIVQAALKGAKKSNVFCEFILCLYRGNDTYNKNLETLNIAAKYLNNDVAAVDLAGAEALFPTKDYKDLFELAQKKEIPYTIHAGEAAGIESVREAMSFGTKRIGHGIYSYKDSMLLNELRSKDILCELCPSSNIVTRVFNDISNFPIKQFLKAGVKVNINTDDPSVINTTIKEEYKKMMQYCHITKDEIKTLLKNSVSSSFADINTKKSMYEKIDADFNRFR